MFQGDGGVGDECVVHGVGEATVAGAEWIEKEDGVVCRCQMSTDRGGTLMYYGERHLHLLLT